MDIGILATPRGNGKVALGGALAVWALFDDDVDGLPAGADRRHHDQPGHPRCYGVAVAMIKARAGALSARSLIFTGVTTPRVTVPYNEGELFPISNDPDGLQGLDPSLAIVDEIGFQPVESWDSLRMGAGKRERSTIIGVGTPGFDHDNALWHVRKAWHDGVKLQGLHFREFAAPDGCDVGDRKAWRTANPAIKAGLPARVGAGDGRGHHDRGPLPPVPPRPARRGYGLLARPAWPAAPSGMPSATL